MDRATVAALLGLVPNTVTTYLQRYPEGDPHEFPRPDEWVGRSPYWRNERADEIAAWAGPGRGSGGGRPRNTDKLGKGSA